MLAERRVLWLSTAAFTLCFAVWTMYAILGLKVQDELALSASQFGTLIAVPVLIGSVARLPLGMLADRFGGRGVFSGLMAVSAVPTFLVSQATTYQQFLWCGAGFGLAGAGFAVGTAYVSAWTAREHQGTALGIFGVGNVGSAFTSFALPQLLVLAPSWRVVPQLYAALLAVAALAFYLAAPDDPARHTRGLTLGQRLAPLRRIQVWRFGLYYFLVFGGFVALGNWLPKYYKGVYGLPLEQIGVITMAFLIPASFIRAFGGWLSDRLGARQVMYGVLAISVACATVLALPLHPGVWSFTAVLFVLGVALGIGKAAVYRYIPDYYPREVGVVGGIVGMLGGLGGFFLPIAWGFLLDWTGLYPVAIFASLACLGAASLVWLHYVVQHFLVPREARP